MKMLAVLDANCFIDAVNPCATMHPFLQHILSAWRSGMIELGVSRHTLAELAKKPDQAFDLAKSVRTLPYWPIGTIAEQITAIEELAGTWEDAHLNQSSQLELVLLAKAGTSIRDRGALIDALRAHADALVTSDKELVAAAPAHRIQERFGVRVVAPSMLASELGYTGVPTGPDRGRSEGV
jgi:predicted nucleic acid-binding protein